MKYLPYWGSIRKGSNFDSQTGIPEHVATIVVVFALLFFLYIGIRVWITIKNSNHKINKRKKRKS